MLLYIGIMLLLKIAESSVYSSANQIKYEKFIDTQKHMIENVKSYIGDIPDKNIVKRYINRYQRENSKAMKNVALYLANPLNCYVLVKSISHDLSHVEDVLTEYIYYVRPKNLLYPTDKDYETISTVIISLVNDYELNITELANGNLTGDFRGNAEKITVLTTPLTSSDCYQLGLATYEHRDYDASLAWTKQALRKYPKDCNRDCPFTDLDLSQFIRRTHFVKDRLKNFDSLSMNEASKAGGKIATDGNKKAVFEQFQDQDVSAKESHFE